MRFNQFRDRIVDRFNRDLSTYLFRRRLLVRLSHPLVSFTFDDFPSSAVTVGGAILEEHGFAGTFYTSLGLAGKDGPVGRYFSEADLPGLLERGHDLGCHTFDHRNAWETPPGEYELSVTRNRQRLAELLPGAEFTSHSYPIYCPRPRNKVVAEKYFPCARGGGQKPNDGVVDANALSAFFIEKSRDDFSAIKEQIERTRSSGSWLIFATHDVGDDAGPFGCSRELFSRIVRYVRDAGIAVLPVSRALALVRGEPES